MPNMGKRAPAQPPPRVYRDEPDHDDATSISSAVPLGDVDFRGDNANYSDADLPAYEDVAHISSASSATIGAEEEPMS